MKGKQEPSGPVRVPENRKPETTKWESYYCITSTATLYAKAVIEVPRFFQVIGWIEAGSPGSARSWQSGGNLPPQHGDWRDILI